MLWVDGVFLGGWGTYSFPVPVTQDGKTISWSSFWWIQAQRDIQAVLSCFNLAPSSHDVTSPIGRITNNSFRQPWIHVKSELKTFDKVSWSSYLSVKIKWVVGRDCFWLISLISVFGLHHIKLMQWWFHWLNLQDWDWVVAFIQTCHIVVFNHISSLHWCKGNAFKGIFQSNSLNSYMKWAFSNISGHER